MEQRKLHHRPSAERSFYAEGPKAALKQIAEKLKSAAAAAKQLKEQATNADASIDQVDKEDK